MNQEEIEQVLLGAEIMHTVADQQNDAADHDEYHAAGAVMSLLTGGTPTEQESQYIFRWLGGLYERML